MYYYRNKYGIRICSIWYNEPEKLERHCFSVVDYNSMSKIPDTVGYKYEIYSQKGYTLQTNLNDDIASIMSSYNKNVRYEIRRADREQIKFHMYFSKDLLDSPEIVDSFDDEYVNMYRMKGINMSSIKHMIVDLCKKENLCMSVACYMDSIIAYHVYLLADDTVRLTYSVSLFRDKEEIDAALIGRANRWLHHQDILWFKNEGYKVYDWGGFTKGEELAGIDDFKKGFGGELKTVYYKKATNSLFLSLSYQLLRQLRGIIGR